jgi:hypothetical protein
VFNLFQSIANDPNVDPALRTVLSSQIAVRGSDRWLEVRAEERADEQREERREAIARGE